jgi:hypothetical protein
MVVVMAGEFVEFFNELLFGSGSWLGLIIICILMLVLASMNKYAGIIAMPIGIFLSIEYATRGLGWHAVLSMLAAIFCLYLGVEKVRKKQ